MINVPCGFCSQKMYVNDLFSHVMSSHPQMIEHLKAEALKAIPTDAGVKCGVLATTYPERTFCTKPALVIPELVIPCLAKQDILSNPEPKNVVISLKFPMCGDHAIEVMPSDIFKHYGEMYAWIQDQVDRAGLVPDWLKSSFRFKPFIQPPVN